MKKILKTTLAAFIFLTVPVACSTSSNSPLAVLPNIANFTIQAVSSFVAGASTVISIASSTLGNGIFTVNYSLSGANNLSNLTATMTVNGSSATFSTPVLPTSGETTITINSISNSSGGSSAFTSQPTYSFSDSIGLMTATVNGVAYRATHVIASSAGGLITIAGTKWNPLTGITLHVYNYVNAPITANFNANDASNANGDAAYNLAAPTGGIADLSQHGTIAITQVSPLVVGTFTFTNQDSSVVTGSFSCPHP